MAIFDALEPSFFGPMLAFDFEHFRELVFTHGGSVRWEKAVACPCRRIHTAGGLHVDHRSKAHRADCPSCRGTGTMYVEPQLIKALVVEASVRPEFYRLYGSIATGMARFTTLPEHMMSKRDRLTLLSSVRIIDDERATRRGDLDELTFPIAVSDRIVGDPSDHTSPVTMSSGIDYILKANHDGTVGSRMVQGRDFDIEDGKIRWYSVDSPPPDPPDDVDPDPPAVGDDFVVRYQANPAYVVRVVMHTHRDSPDGQFKRPMGWGENVRRYDCWLHDITPFPEET